MEDRFSLWYGSYPRKVSRKDALVAWKKLTPDQQTEALQALPVHVSYWNATGTSKEFMPYPATWLNGERWTDELEVPVKDQMGEWWKTTAGIQKKAVSLGMQAKPGEDWHQLKARIMAKERAA